MSYTNYKINWKREKTHYIKTNRKKRKSQYGFWESFWVFTSLFKSPKSARKTIIL